MRRKKQYPKLTPAPTQVSEVKADVAEGFSVHERIVRGRDGRGNEVEVDRGFILAYNDGDVTQYSGRTLLWQPKVGMVDAMFKTKDQAEQAAEQCRKQWTTFAEFNSRKYPIREVMINAPFAIVNGQESNRPTQIHGRLTLVETRKLQSLRIALRQVNAEYEPGRPIQNDFQVLRWLLSRCVPNDLSDESVSSASSASTQSE